MSDYEVTTGVPDSLLAALDIYQGDPDSIPPQGTPSLRAMYRVDGQPSKADLEWIAEREAKVADADRVWQEITEIAPMPTYDEIVASEVIEYPSWAGTKWGEVLGYFWAEDFDEALDEAKEYLANERASRAKA